MIYAAATDYAPFFQDVYGRRLAIFYQLGKRRDWIVSMSLCGPVWAIVGGLPKISGPFQRVA